MKIAFVQIQNFRKLKNCKIDFGDENTLFVGPNNSGKTSAMEALVKFLARKEFKFNDITLSNHNLINEIGNEWVKESSIQSKKIVNNWEQILPALDIWLDIEDNEMQYISDIIPNLNWEGKRVGVRLLFQPVDELKMYSEYLEIYNNSRSLELKNKKKEKSIQLWPIDLCDYISKKIGSLFTIKSYILDCKKIDYENSIPQELDCEMECIQKEPLKKIIKIDIIEAQRGFYDPDSNKNESTSKGLSLQLRNYYDKHLDPEISPSEDDLKILQAIEDAKVAFDENLKEKFKKSLSEVENLGYPGINNPIIKIESKISATEALKHESAIQYEVPHSESINNIYHLPEQYNGLGYQNLISMVFKLITFRDDWMRVGKFENKEDAIEPLHLILIEEPEAHLHIQVQQVFIKQAYKILIDNEILTTNKNFKTQLIISTHSSHIVKEVQFSDLRYFKRMPITCEDCIPTTQVINLSKVFSNENIADEEDKVEQTEKFVTRYLRTTHCDIFFADALVLVEGAAENMLLPHFIRNKYNKLNQMYITIFEINGRHSHRLKPLIERLGINTLIITDLDTASNNGNHKHEEPKRNNEQITTNYAITNWILNKNNIDDLLAINKLDKVKKYENPLTFSIKIAYQTPISINFGENVEECVSSTFEDSLIYTNFTMFNKEFDEDSMLNKISNIIKEATSFSELHSRIYEKVREISFQKAEFALDLIYAIDPKEIEIPDYINDGLVWLEEQLTIQKDKLEGGINE